MDSRISDWPCEKPAPVSLSSGAVPDEGSAVRRGGWPPQHPLPDGSSPLQICVTGDPPIVELAGDIDEWTYPQLAGVLAMAATAGERRIRVDLAGVEYCDLAGLRAMISLAYPGDGQVSPEQVVLAHLPGSLRTALRILGWDAAPGLILEEGACWT